MNDENDPNAKSSPEAETATGAETQTSAAADAGAAAQGEAADPIAALEKENSELKDQMLRLVAEMDNLRKRTEREIKDTRAYAIANFARDMLVATDNLSRALMVVSTEARENADATTKSLIEGIEMTEREMLRLLEKNGISPIEAEGVKFDPHQHQAMFDVPNPDVPEGTVVQVVQTGFAIGERVLRPAMVGVAKGGPKTGKPESAVGENQGAGQGGHIDKEA